MLQTVNAAALLGTLAVLTVWLAQAYAKVQTEGRWDKGRFWRNVRFIIGSNWIFNVTMFTMFYFQDGTLPELRNWIMQIGFTFAVIAIAIYFDPKRRHRNKS